jgi:hypothetical protein
MKKIKFRLGIKSGFSLFFILHLSLSLSFLSLYVAPSAIPTVAPPRPTAAQPSPPPTLPQTASTASEATIFSACTSI